MKGQNRKKGGKGRKKEIAAGFRLKRQIEGRGEETEDGLMS